MPSPRQTHKMQAKPWLHYGGLVLLAFLFAVPDFIVALKDVAVTIPQAVKRGSDAQLTCNYDMENDTLYSVKWYKGRREFYRYTPKENPAMKVFAMASGLNVARNLSNQSHVVLVAVPLNISGKFTCEISVEAPTFQTAMVSAEMEVVELPEEQAIVTGIQPRYRIGDLVDGNCSIKFSKPAANLTWTINGIVVPPHHIKTYQIEKFEVNNLESVLSAVHFMVTTQHFIKGQMRLKCTASIFDIFKEEIESIIEEDRPRIMASGRSYDMNNYPYEQHASGDGGFEDHNESYLTYYSAPSSAPPTLKPFLHTLQKRLQRIWGVASAAHATVLQKSAHNFKNLLQKVNNRWRSAVDDLAACCCGGAAVLATAVTLMLQQVTGGAQNHKTVAGATLKVSKVTARATRVMVQATTTKTTATTTTTLTTSSAKETCRRKCFQNCQETHWRRRSQQEQAQQVSLSAATAAGGTFTATPKDQRLLMALKDLRRPLNAAICC